MKRKRIIIEHDLPDNMDMGEWYSKLVGIIKREISDTVFIAVEDVKEPTVLAGYRNPAKR